MLLRFTKMHGLKNDFVVIDLVTQNCKITADKVRKLADRRTGIGFDQLLLVLPPKKPDVDFFYRIFNADGSEVEQCGNGARCFAQFVLEHRLSNKKILTVETLTGIMTLTVKDNKQIVVNMGQPILSPKNIPFSTDHQALYYTIEVAGEAHKIQVISMGNPHCVLLVNNIEKAPVQQLGEQIEKHPRFPNNCNVGFMQIQSPQEISLRVWERGAGETMACGSGACAAVVAGRLNKKLNDDVTVHLRGGDLNIRWAGEGSSVLMEGSATRVFEGQIRL